MFKSLDGDTPSSWTACDDVYVSVLSTSVQFYYLAVGSRVQSGWNVGNVNFAKRWKERKPLLFVNTPQLERHFRIKTQKWSLNLNLGCFDLTPLKLQTRFQKHVCTPPPPSTSSTPSTRMWANRTALTMTSSKLTPQRKRPSRTEPPPPLPLQVQTRAGDCWRQSGEEQTEQLLSFQTRESVQRLRQVRFISYVFHSLVHCSLYWKPGLAVFNGGVFFDDFSLNTS